MVDLGEVGPVLSCCGGYPWHLAHCSKSPALNAENVEALRARFLAAQNERPSILPPFMETYGNPALVVSDEMHPPWTGKRWPPIQVVGAITGHISLVVAWLLAEAPDVTAEQAMTSAALLLLGIYGWITR